MDIDINIDIDLVKKNQRAFLPFPIPVGREPGKVKKALLGTPQKTLHVHPERQKKGHEISRKGKRNVSVPGASID